MTSLFSNGDSLGVTYQHLIYSTTANDWRPAGTLQAGERILTRTGEAIVVKLEKKAGREIVYNLEIKELHNFLVSASEIVVHNTCFFDKFKDAWNHIKPNFAIPKNHRNIRVKNATLCHKLAARAIGVKERNLNNFAKAVIDKDWDRIKQMGFEVKDTRNLKDKGKAIYKLEQKTVDGKIVQIESNSRYRTPVIKSEPANRGKLVGDIEHKPSDLTCPASMSRVAS